MNLSESCLFEGTEVDAEADGGSVSLGNDNDARTPLCWLLYGCDDPFGQHPVDFRLGFGHERMCNLPGRVYAYRLSLKSQLDSIGLSELA